MNESLSTGTEMDTILWPWEDRALSGHSEEDDKDNWDTDDDETDEEDGDGDDTKDNKGDDSADDENDEIFLFPSMKDTCDNKSLYWCGVLRRHCGGQTWAGREDPASHVRQGGGRLRAMAGTMWRPLGGVGLVPGDSRRGFTLIKAHGMLDSSCIDG